MLQDSATPKMVRNVINGTTPPKKIVGSYEQLEDGTYNLIIGLTGDAPSAAAISQINGEELAGKEFYDYVRTEGAVLFSFNPDFSPAALYGGSWEKITDRFLIGAGGSYALGSTGGGATHAHDVVGVTRLFNQEASHFIYQYKQDNNYWTSTSYMDVSSAGEKQAENVPGGIATYGTANTASNMPPYIAANIWRRVA